jgi:hypothetical protein
MGDRLTTAQTRALLWLYEAGGARGRFERGFPDTMVVFRLACLGYLAVESKDGLVFTLDPSARYVLTQQGHERMAQYQGRRGAGSRRVSRAHQV